MCEQDPNLRRMQRPFNPICSDRLYGVAQEFGQGNFEDTDVSAPFGKVLCPQNAKQYETISNNVKQCDS